MKQEVLAGIILFVMGLCFMTLSPEKLWTFSEKWKTEDGTKPSKSYIAVMRILGIILALTGAVLVIKR